MNTTLVRPILFIIAAAIFAGAVYLVLLGQKPVAFGAANEVQATIATSSTLTLSTTPILIFATSSCGTRIISTTASPIMLIFTDAQGDVPSGQVGVLQGASTTANYSNGTYGCAAVRAYSFTTSTIRAIESR